MAAQELLVDVRCPHCNQLWFKMLGFSIIEIKCPKCKRTWTVSPGTSTLILTEQISNEEKTEPIKKHPHTWSASATVGLD